jgi:TDG/mug DNA glycosylase family protein
MPAPAAQKIRNLRGFCGIPAGRTFRLRSTNSQYATTLRSDDETFIETCDGAISYSAEHLRPGLKLVFCGTAAGRQSALQKAYYAHPQNKFWRTLEAVGLTPRRFTPQDYPALWDLGIGLTDIAKFAYGMDHQLPRHSLGPRAAAALRARILKVAPGHLAFTSLTAGRAVLGKTAVAGEQKERWRETRLWVLPSPSPLADNHWDVAPWQVLAKAVRGD